MKIIDLDIDNVEVIQETTNFILCKPESTLVSIASNGSEMYFPYAVYNKRTNTFELQFQAELSGREALFTMEREIRRLKELEGEASEPLPFKVVGDESDEGTDPVVA